MLSSADVARAACAPGITAVLHIPDVVFADTDGGTLHGFAPARGTGSGEEPLKVSFVASNASEAYFYTETCDICSDLIKCDLASGEATFFKSGHELACPDLPADAVTDPECKA